MKNKKKIIIIVSIIAVLLLGLGIAYAGFIYNKTGSTNEQLITGDIYMHYLESNTLTITDAIPRNTYDPAKYFEFSVDGKNTTTNHDIYYDIQLIRGAVPTGKVEANRILDRFVRFRLVSVSNNVETEIFTNKKYSDLSTSKRVHVTTIPRNTTSEISHVYRLYMWIGDDIKVANAEYDDKDYSISEWNNIFASVRVDVTGDFEDKELAATDDSCFSVRPAFVLNNLSDEQLGPCIGMVTDSNIHLDTGTTPISYCQGTGTYRQLTLQQHLDNDDFESESFFQRNLISMYYLGIISVSRNISITDYDASCGPEVVIPSTMPLSGSYVLNDLTNPNNESALNACVSFFSSGDHDISEFLDSGSTVTSYCQGTGTTDGGRSLQGEITAISLFANEIPDFIQYLLTNNVIVEDTEEKNVTIIKTAAFRDKSLTSVVIPNGVEKLYEDSFTINSITNVAIPASVTFLECEAFDDGVTINMTNNPNLECSNQNIYN